MLLCMRTYFQGVLPRVVGSPHPLERLPDAELLALVDRRVDLEDEPVQRAMRTDAARKVIEALMTRATTPLALLTWVKEVAESKQAFADPVEVHATRWQRARYALYRKAIEATLKLFAEKETEGIDAVPSKELLAAIGDDQEALRYLQSTEIVLPQNFWDPTHFVLDPSAAWIARPRA